MNTVGHRIIEVVNSVKSGVGRVRDRSSWVRYRRTVCWLGEVVDGEHVEIQIHVVGYDVNADRGVLGCRYVVVDRDWWVIRRIDDDSDEGCIVCCTVRGNVVEGVTPDKFSVWCVLYSSIGAVGCHSVGRLSEAGDG